MLIEYAYTLVKRYLVNAAPSIVNDRTTLLGFWPNQYWIHILKPLYLGLCLQHEFHGRPRDINSEQFKSTFGKATLWKARRRGVGILPRLIAPPLTVFFRLSL